MAAEQKELQALDNELNEARLFFLKNKPPANPTPDEMKYGEHIYKMISNPKSPLNYAKIIFTIAFTGMGEITPAMIKCFTDEHRQLFAGKNAAFQRLDQQLRTDLAAKGLTVKEDLYDNMSTWLEEDYLKSKEFSDYKEMKPDDKEKAIKDLVETHKGYLKDAGLELGDKFLLQLVYESILVGNADPKETDTQKASELRTAEYSGKLFGFDIITIQRLETFADIVKRRKTCKEKDAAQLKEELAQLVKKAGDKIPTVAFGSGGVVQSTKDTEKLGKAMQNVNVAGSPTAAPTPPPTPN